MSEHPIDQYHAPLSFELKNAVLLQEKQLPSLMANCEALHLHESFTAQAEQTRWVLMLLPAMSETGFDTNYFEYNIRLRQCASLKFYVIYHKNLWNISKVVHHE